MFKRKLIAAALTFVSLLAVLIGLTVIFNPSRINEIGEGIFFVSLYALPAIFVYGLVISYLSDLLLNKYSGLKRIVLAGSMHILLAGLFWIGISALFDRNVNIFYEFNVFWSLNQGLIILALFCGACYWLFDELQRNKKVKV